MGGSSCGAHLGLDPIPAPPSCTLNAGKATWGAQPHRAHPSPQTLVQVGLYAMGRDPEVFPKPEQFSPQRWLAAGPKPFKGLGFGFGPRQCLGRRIAELEMQLFLMQILENFKIETMRAVEVGTKFDLILIPDKPIYLTLRPLESRV
ncbi:cholesterol side-chain cleavage enzyme, mitochondrial-like [Athene noctua]|uniref:cholesterol side-chain cleavage enzyme, mitochondrial-like n=1 Tax=Athene noctua TaxID=126797 RepID=UPI003EB6F58E